MINTNQNFIIHNLFKIFFILFVALLFSSCNEMENISLFKKAGSSTKNKDMVSVATLLPISGDEAEYYQELNKMIKLGLADGAKGKIKVTSYDSSTKQILSESLDKIISNNTDIVIGPLFSEPTEYAAVKLKGQNISLVTLSNNPVLADKNIFVFGHAPMRQMEYLVDQLLKNDYHNYIALLPSGRYSQSVSAVIQEMLKSRDAALVRVEYYNNEEADIARAVKIVSDNVDNLNEADYNLTQPVVLVADDSHTLKTVLNYAAHYKLDKKAVLAGDGRVNLHTDKAVNLLFTGAIHENKNNVLRKASKLNVIHVGFMHELAYDAGRIVASNLAEGYSQDNFANKMKTTSYEGLSGKIHFIDSIAQRHYDVIKKQDNTFMPFNTKPASVDFEIVTQEGANDQTNKPDNANASNETPEKTIENSAEENNLQ